MKILMHKNGPFLTGAGRLKKIQSGVAPLTSSALALSVHLKKLDVSIDSVRGVRQF